MKRLWLPLAFVAFAVFFFVSNRGAYKGYFDGDDLDNLNMTDGVSVDLLVNKFLSPKLDQSNFRPVGHAFFRYFGRSAGLNYGRYIVFIQAAHLVNVLLAWLVLRALGFSVWNAAFGTLFFAFNMGTFEIYWKPMYVFDLFCATLTLTSILLWLHQRWLLSLLAFWCAFRAKEVAIALPLILALIEYTRGTRRWKWLLPFFAISLNFGLQAAFGNRARDNDYTLRFTFDALKKCAAFYGNRILVVPYGGAFVAALIFIKDNRARLGVLTVLLFIGPMLFLPGRLFGAYLYVPLIGLAIAMAALSHQLGRIVAAILVLLWLPLNYREMQQRRKQQLAIADQNRQYVARVMEFVKSSPATGTFIFDKSPEGLHSWGVREAVRYAIRPRRKYEEAEIRSKAALDFATRPNLAYLMWIPGRDLFYIVSRNQATPDIPYIVMNQQTPLWQLGDGWHGLETNFQWTNLVADARLARPAGANRFEVLLNVGPLLIEKLKVVKFEVQVDGVKVGEREFTTAGWRSLQFDVPPSSSPVARIIFRAAPGYFYEDHNPADALGIAIGGFGFPTERYPALGVPQ